VAARAARRFPVILDLLSRGKLNLTTIRLLAPHLTPDNYQGVLESARGKPKVEVEEIVARPRRIARSFWNGSEGNAAPVLDSRQLATRVGFSTVGFSAVRFNADQLRRGSASWRPGANAVRHQPVDARRVYAQLVEAL
jgi:hypothetical protein